MKQIQLGGRNNTKIKGYALVDDDTFDELNQYNWCFDGDYASRCIKENGKWRKLKMHRIIMNPENTMQIDHIDGDKLNNQKSNLRTCTNAENSRNKKLRSDNKSGAKGVHFSKRDKVFTAYITFNRKNIHLGTFKEKEFAIKAYNDAALMYFNKFANLNTV